MPEGEGGTAGGQAPPAGGAGAGAGAGTGAGGSGSGAPPAGGSPGGQAPQGTGADTSKYDKELKEARDEAAKFRTELRNTQAELKKLTDANLTEDQKRVARIEELEKTLKDQAAEMAKANAKARSADVMAAAVQAGAKKPAMIARLIDDTEPDIAKAVAALKKDSPELFASGTPGGAAADAGKGGQQPTHNMNDVLRAGFGRGR